MGIHVFKFFFIAVSIEWQTSSTTILYIAGTCYLWIGSHLLGLLHLLVPIGVVLSWWSNLYLLPPELDHFYVYAFIAALVHTVNFHLLAYPVKSVIGQY